MKRILIATDFSNYANLALKRAVLIAHENNMPLDGMHVMYNDWLGVLFNMFSNTLYLNEEQLKNNIKTIFMKEVKSYCQKKGIQIIPSFTVTSGQEHRSIKKYAKKKKSGLIVIGAQGDNYLENFIIGSTAENVVEHANIPVLLVRQNPSIKYKKILISIDLSLLSLLTVKFAIEMFPDSEIHLLHVVDFSRSKKSILYLTDTKQEKTLYKNYRVEQKDKLNKFINKYKFNNSKIKIFLRSGYPPAVINNFANYQKINLIVIGTRGQSKFHYIFLGSVAKKLLQITKKDVLIIPPKK